MQHHLLIKNMELPWLRWCHNQGNLLLTAWERSERLAQKLRELGINPDELQLGVGNG